MAGEITLPTSGNDLIDSLRGLQIMADMIEDRSVKLDRIKAGLRILPVEELLGKQLMVDAINAFGQDPEQAPGTKKLFSEGVFFIGSLIGFKYLIDDSFPVDSLALGFDTPEFIGADEEDALVLRRLSLQVPILSIDSCVSTEAA